MKLANQFVIFLGASCVGCATIFPNGAIAQNGLDPTQAMLTCGGGVVGYAYPRDRDALIAYSKKEGNYQVLGVVLPDGKKQVLGHDKLSDLPTKYDGKNNMGMGFTLSKRVKAAFTARVMECEPGRACSGILADSWQEMPCSE